MCIHPTFSSDIVTLFASNNKEGKHVSLTEKTKRYKPLLQVHPFQFVQKDLTVCDDDSLHPFASQPLIQVRNHLFLVVQKDQTVYGDD